MAEALRLDILIDEDGSARRAVDEFSSALRKAGIDAESAAKQVDKFEQEYLSAASAAKKATEAQNKSTDATNRAGRAAESAAASKQKQASATSALTGAVARYVAPAAIGLAISRTLDWAGKLSDLSKSTGISTESLQKFEIIGNRSGVTMQGIASTALMLSDRLAGGNKSAAAALEKFGVNMGALTAMRPEDALREVAKAAGEIANPMERVAFLTDVAGKTGAKTLLPMIEDLGTQWDKTSGIINNKGIQALDDLGDAFGDLGIVGKQFLADVLIPLAPGFTALTTEVLSFVSATMPKLQSWFSGVIEGFFKADAAMASFEDNMRNSGLRELDKMDPARAAAFRQANGIAPGGFFNNAQAARDKLGAFQFQPPTGGDSGGMFGPAFFQPSALIGGKKSKTGAPVVPYTSNQWANIMAVLGAGNPMGNGGLGGFPGFAFPDALQSSMSRSLLGIGFDRGSVMAPFSSATMVSPASLTGGGSWLSNLFGGRGGAMAGAGLGALTSIFGSKLGLSGTGQSIGAMAGSFFGPLGSALGGLGGGLIGKLFGGGSKDRKQIAGITSGEDFAAIKTKAEELGISMDKVFSAKKVGDFQKALKGVTDQIAAQEAEQNKVHEAMERWGLTIEDMGPKFKQTEMDKTAKGFMEDFYSLVNAGADVNKVIDKMGPSIGNFVHSSIEMGTKVPLEMKKIIEEMIKQGKLLDKNGEKFTDLSQIPFAENLNDQFSSLITKLDALLDRVFGLGDAFDKAAGSAGNFNREAGNANFPEGKAEGAARGGIVGDKGNILYFRRGGFVPHGTDTVPAMLTPGEMVIARDQVKAMAKGGRPSSVTVNLNIAGYLDSPKVQRDLTRVVTEAIDRDVRMRRVG